MSNQRILAAQRDKLWSSLHFNNEKFNNLHFFCNDCHQKLICKANWLYNSLSQWNSIWWEDHLHEAAHQLQEQNKLSSDLPA